mmetsp:Transcript_395/g.778  ORF Transcript_395/g.778 Transcript_395/m.778 type:complete len:211 (+) Transcript_395:72-704(+)
MAEKTQRSCADPNIGRELRCGHSRLERRTLQGFSHSTRPELRRSRLWHHWARRQINRALFTSRGSSCSPALSFLQKRVFHVSNLQIVALNPHKRHASPVATADHTALSSPLPTTCGDGLPDTQSVSPGTPAAAPSTRSSCGTTRSSSPAAPSSTDTGRVAAATWGNETATRPWRSTPSALPLLAIRPPGPRPYRARKRLAAVIASNSNRQ